MQMLCRECSTRIEPNGTFCKECGREGYRPAFSEVDYVQAIDRVWEEAETRLGAPMRSQHSIATMMELWRYAKSQLDTGLDETSANQAAWRLLHNSVAKAIRQSDSDLMTNLEKLEADTDALKTFHRAVEAKRQAHPHDYGFRVPIGFLLIGSLLSFLFSHSVAGAVIGGVASWLTGLLFSIFVINSTAIQFAIGFRLEGTMFKGIGRWLIIHSLKEYSEG